MNKNMRSLILTLCCALSATLLLAQDQKFGHLNSAILLQQLPEVKAADAQLEGFQAGLMSSGQEKVKSLETKYTSYMSQVEKGELTRVEMQAKESEINEERNSIANYEKEVQLKIIQKRQELLEPILQKVDEAIKAIGKEQGYSMIFDTSISGTMLYAPEGDDIMDMVLAKLGVSKTE